MYKKKKRFFYSNFSTTGVVLYIKIFKLKFNKTQQVTTPT